MFGWLGKLFGVRTAVENSRRNPVLLAAVAKSATIYSQIPLGEFIGEETRAEQARQLYLKINEICNSRDPLTTCRERLCVTMLELAMYQVLFIPPAPDDDVTGLRGEPGITGELKEHLFELSRVNDDLHALLSASGEPITRDSIWEILSRSYWETYWLLESINAVRIELGDYDDDDDWYRAFMHAAGANSEHLYRRNLDMPSCFDEDVADIAPTAYSIFTDTVLSGTENPGLEWREYYKDSNVPFMGDGTQ